ncbi:MAG TPA: hypothetical protein VD837_08490 [Terriglobales bacterium]|nr:hypothetical protein [Terriglobales bacterium]
MKKLLVCALLTFFVITASAKERSGKDGKDAPKGQPTVLSWPAAEKPVVRFTLGPIVKLGSSNGNNGYDIDVKAENLWDKSIDNAVFLLQFFDAERVRVGEREMHLRQIGAGEVAKFRMTVGTIGDPVSMRLIAQEVPAELQNFALPKSIQLTVYSVPSGAELKLDSKLIGSTPQKCHTDHRQARSGVFKGWISAGSAHPERRAE